VRPPWTAPGARLHLPRDLHIAYVHGRMALTTSLDTYPLWYDSPVTARLSAGVTIDSVPLDNGFTGWSRRAVIDWPERGARLVMAAERGLDFVTVFIPPSLPFFCVEPVSHVTDAVNRTAPAAEVGRRTLDPGATLQASITLTPELTG